MTENTMKTKRDQRHKGAIGQGGKGVSAGYKATPSRDKPTSGVTAHAHIKPLAGKVFYLDLPSNRITDTLESDIRALGGTVEKFFSKEIKYLVSNKREARYVRCLRQNSPVPSPDSGQSSPHPRSNQHQVSSHGDNVKSRCQDQTDTLVTSRGKSLLEKVVKEQRVQINKILSNALEWGVKILYIDDVIAYLKKKKKVVSSQCLTTTANKTNLNAETKEKKGPHKCKGGRISKPFVKVEDSSRHYRPIYLTMPNMPQFNLKTLPPCSPFLVDDKEPPGNKRRGHRGVKASTSEGRAHGRKKNRDKKGGGYCECCAVKYNNMSMHLKNERHRAFSKSKKYVVLDKLISTMHCDFIHIRSQVQRSRCSVSSVLIAPGPCVKTEQRHKEDLDMKEIIYEQQQNVHKGFCSGQSSKIRSAPPAAAAALTHRGEHRRSHDTCSDSSKHKSVGRKRLCRQNSLTFCTLPKIEIAPSRGEYSHPDPCRVKSVDLAEQIITENTNSSSSHLHSVIRQTYSPSKILNSETNQLDDSQYKQDSSVFESAQDRNVLLEKIPGTNVSEKEEDSLMAQSFSPVRKIQRRIRVYKRKRRKVDAHVEHLKPCDVTDNSRLKLWELFQSSDDTDVEFLGFGE